MCNEIESNLLNYNTLMDADLEYPMTCARLLCVQVFNLIPWLVYRIMAFHLIKIRNTVSKRKVAMGNLMIFFIQESCWL